MKLGVVGLPNVGKSTLFNAITQAGAEIANYPFCTIEPKNHPTYLKFVDIAGLVKGASRGEGLGNKFLSHIREVDAIVHVVRCFVDSNVTHVSDAIDPVADITTINLELILADIETVNARLAKAVNMQKPAKKKKNIRRKRSCLNVFCLGWKAKNLCVLWNSTKTSARW